MDATIAGYAFFDGPLFEVVASGFFAPLQKMHDTTAGNPAIQLPQRVMIPLWLGQMAA